MISQERKLSTAEFPSAHLHSKTVVIRKYKQRVPEAIGLRVPRRATQTGTRVLRRPRVLIVEDSLLIAMFIDEIAQSCGCDIAGTAYTLQEAREALARHDYDAVLLDIGLQTDRSFEIADVLSERKVPFAFLTAYEEILEPRHQNVPILLKPFSTDALVRTVHGLVGLKERATGALPLAG